jgi:hypothetical protein
MTNDNVIVILLIIVMVIGFFFIGVGFNGKVVYDNRTVKELCSDNDECKSPEVCCKFYMQNSGVCHSSDMCSRIVEITKEEKDTSEKVKKLIYEKPENKFYDLDIIFGLLLVGFVIITFYYIHRKDKSTIDKPLKKKRKRN